MTLFRFPALLLLMALLPLAGLSAQDAAEETEALRLIERAFEQLYALDTYRYEFDSETTVLVSTQIPAPVEGEEDIEFSFSLPTTMKARAAIRQVAGRATQIFGLLRVSVGNPEVRDSSVEIPPEELEMASRIELAFVIADEKWCIYPIWMDGEAHDNSLNEMNELYQSLSELDQAQYELFRLLKDVPAADWLLSLEELPGATVAGQPARRFSLRTVRAYEDMIEQIEELLAAQDLDEIVLPHLDEFMSSLLNDALFAEEIWIGEEDGMIHQYNERMSSSGVIDATADPALGITMSIGYTVDGVTRFLDFDRLTEEDFALPCLPR